jgi:hypothetical protein
MWDRKDRTLTRNRRKEGLRSVFAPLHRPLRLCVNLFLDTEHVRHSHRYLNPGSRPME